MCSVWDSALGAHCLDSTHGLVSSDGGPPLRRLPAVRIAARVHYTRTG